MSTFFALLFLVSFIVAIVGFVMMFIKRKQPNSKLYRTIGIIAGLMLVIIFI